MDASKVIIEPVVTEKSTMLREGDAKTYTFKVAKSANKIMIMRAVKEIFNVRPTSCRIISVHGKMRRNRAVSRSSFRRGTGREASWKKAMVTIEKGRRIDALEGA